MAFVSLLVFVLMAASPGDPAQIMLGLEATPEGLRAMRHEMGIDRPLLEQYVRFVSDVVLRGDLGRSLQTREPVADAIARTWPATIELSITALGTALLVGVPIGILTAVRRGGWVDQVTRIFVLIGASIPIFWLGLLLIYVFAVGLGLLPTSGRGTPEHLVLPSVSLAMFSLATVVRLTRSSMLEVLGEDYVRTARAKGLGNLVVLVRHGFRNALIPVVSIVGLQFGHLLGGTALTETVFDWPGTGRLLVTAVFSRDYPTIRAAILLIAAVFIVVNLIVDLLYVVLDPRIRLDQR